MSLPSRQAQVLAVILEAAEAGERCPMNRVIATRIDVAGTATVSEAITALEAKGTINVIRGSNSRVIEIAGTGLRTAGVTRAKRGPQVRHLPIPPRVFRQPCPRCGIRADIGCRHFIAGAEMFV